MSSTQEASGGDGGKANKTDKTRRIWSPREEDILIAALKELVAQGWKSDNGFRGGYLKKLEDTMKREFPGTDLKGTPHINSKLCTWKKNYNSLIEILKPSGVGFNLKGTFMIDIDNHQWDEVLKKDNNARNMRYKPWPYLDDWKEIFGKDRATGQSAEDIFDALGKLPRDDNLEEDGIDSEFRALDEQVETENGENSSIGQQAEQVCKSKSKKRKSGDGLENLYALIGDIGRETASRMDMMCSRIGYDHDLAKARKDAFECLSNMQGISEDEKFDVCEMLNEKVSCLEMFRSLPESSRESYVYRLLRKR
ncbi:uncharacterized protein LOC130988473 [Salvia miltiorrhiza]|uniref:uncharacterized protein LOC130988473 n=1 Tax=Salvia miltiorrhiza TaxID=226208 RepID=UPI0025ABC4EA|nr:uncharacterized protein LOC130988473 [Salvia miltiorrhiza]